MARDRFFDLGEAMMYESAYNKMMEDINSMKPVKRIANPINHEEHKPQQKHQFTITVGGKKYSIVAIDKKRAIKKATLIHNSK